MDLSVFDTYLGRRQTLSFARPVNGTIFCSEEVGGVAAATPGVMAAGFRPSSVAGPMSATRAGAAAGATINAPVAQASSTDVSTIAVTSRRGYAAISDITGASELCNQQ